MKNLSFKITFTKSAYHHLQVCKRFDRNKILDKINENLIYNPKKETRNKKNLRPNFLADWELRVDPYRVFYEVNEIKLVVRIVAIGLKEREKLIVGNEEIIL